MSRMVVNIASDGLTAEVRVAPGPTAMRDALDAELRAAHVVFGIDAAAVAALAFRLADPAYAGSAVVARGTAAVPGADARLDSELLHAKTSGTLAADGRIDYRERHYLHPVVAGQPIGTIVPPTAATDGRDVRGAAVPGRPGRPLQLRIGDGVQQRDGQLFAACDGVVFATAREFDVIDLFTHDGDVDYRSGNLHSGGSLLVKGDVTDGFSATAVGDTVVTGSVDGGGVRAGGSVVIGRGVLGASQVVRAGADIECRFLTSARLSAGRAIVVHDQVAQSRLHAREVRVLDGHASVRGGSMRARDSIDVGTAGSEVGARTVLAVAQLLDERAELLRRSSIASQHERAALRARGDRDGRGAKVVRAAIRAGDHQRLERLRLQRRQQELLQRAVVRVRGTCHAGVLVRFAHHELRIDAPLQAAEFHFDAERGVVVHRGTA